VSLIISEFCQQSVYVLSMIQQQIPTVSVNSLTVWCL